MVYLSVTGDRPFDFWNGFRWWILEFYYRFRSVDYVNEILKFSSFGASDVCEVYGKFMSVSITFIYLTWYTVRCSLCLSVTRDRFLVSAIYPTGAGDRSFIHYCGFAVGWRSSPPILRCRSTSITLRLPCAIRSKRFLSPFIKVLGYLEELLVIW
jgi:hypothetical protein